MNYSNRIIPCLLIDDEDLVKTNKFKNPKYIGDPINTCKIFNDKEVDELIIIDIGSQKKRKEPSYKIIKEIASECFMPLSYGGGITSKIIADKLFSSGIEKICIQDYNFESFKLTESIAKKYGNQSVIFSVDIKRNFFGKKKLYRTSKSKFYNLDYIDFIKTGIDHGAGEILLTSIDNEGTMNGLDNELINEVSQNISVPLIASGGVGNLDHIVEGIKSGASAIAIGSFFVFKGPLRGVLISYLNNNDLKIVNSYV